MHLYRFCYTHARPLFQPDPNTILVWVGDDGIPEDLRARSFAVREMYHDLDFYRPWLYGSAATLAALRALRAMPDFSTTGLVVQSSFRKFVSSQSLGREARNFPGLRLATPTEVQGIATAEVPSSGFLLPQPTHIGNLTLHYAQCHRLPDLLRYASICSELGVLSNEECAEFLQGQLLIPGGCELGVLPLDIWADVADRLDRVTMAFCRQGAPVDLSPYQRRAVAFCNERLGSFFVLKHLQARFGNSLPPELFGYLINVDPTQENSYGRGT